VEWDALSRGVCVFSVTGACGDATELARDEAWADALELFGACQESVADQ
jgi:hypothetical protein